MRVGIGYDSHRLVAGRKLIIGGVEIPYDHGLQGHSDADVLCHAVIDAIIGALGIGDIGKHFPDTDSKWQDASSIDMLSETINLMKQMGYSVAWIDSTIIAEQPKISPYIKSMKDRMSEAGISVDAMNIKGKTNEGMGFIGKGEGIAAQAVCLLMKK